MSKLLRASWWDYRWNAAYFVTICTRNRVPYFGKIKEGKMHLSHQGILADVFWHEIRNHIQHVELGAFVVMPDHVHGIIIIEKPGNDPFQLFDNGDVACNITIKDNSTTKDQQMSRISPKAQSLSAIIRSYKSAVTKHANRLELPFAWQSRFHEHIIGDEQAYHQISWYIENNPANWKGNISR